MEARILDRKFLPIEVVDEFNSFIWVDRFLGYGDFELYIPFNAKLLPYLVLGNYVYNRDSDKLMFIDEFSIDSNFETGNFITVKGRSLESILERRVIWGKTTLTGNLQNGIKKLLDESIINPTDPNRRISNFVFISSTDPAITSLEVDTEFFGENLYDAVYSLCQLHDIGFKVIYNFDTSNFEFSLYAGTDRSWAQEKNPWVVFSNKYDNLLSSNYYESDASLATVAMVSREDQESTEENPKPPIVREVKASNATGLDRREIYVESGIYSYVSEDEPEPDYDAEMDQKGREALAEAVYVSAFEGDIEATRQFVFGKDFYMGDIVQVVNEYGMEARSRVSELMFTQDATGYSIVPTFIAVQEEE